MYFGSTDLIEELHREEERVERENLLLEEARAFLEKDRKNDERVLERFRTSSYQPDRIISTEGLKRHRIFSSLAIENLCTKYRLRFLPTKFYKGDLPYEAITRIKEFEHHTGQEVKDMRIIAPDEKFQLQDSTKDPLLFASLGNGKFYLIHKWGNDLSPWRKVLNFPFRNPATLLGTCIAFSLLITLFVPASFYLDESMTGNLIILGKAFSFFLLSVFFITVSLILGITTSKEFSSDQWNSRFFN